MKKFKVVHFALSISLIFFWGIKTISAGFDTFSQARSTSEINRLAEEYFQKAIVLLKKTEYKSAITEYEKVIKLDPTNEIAQDAQYWIGQSHFRMEQFDEAISIFKNLIENYPGSAVIPVTKLMIERTQLAKENKDLRAKRDAVADKKTITDPKTGAEYKKIEILRGKKDVLSYSLGLHISPNGKFLLQNNIVIPLEGGEPFDLIDTYAMRGIWSPDGTKVVYYSGEAICVIPVFPVTGKPSGPTKKILDGRYKFLSPVSWSPDSERVVFMKLDQKTQGDIWILSVKDGTLTQITDDPIVEMNPAWSPDGKKIAYNCGDSEIRLISAQGGEPRKIADIEYGRKIFWSPDNKWIFIQTGRRCVLLRLSDDRIFDVAPPKNVGEFFSWSTDGEKMLFFYDSYDFFNVLKVVSTSGGPSFQLGRELSLSPYTQFWSPDSRVVITSGMTPGTDDWGSLMIPLAGTEAIPLKLNIEVNGEINALSLSPDCERGLFSVYKDNKKEDLFFIPVSLKEARTTGPPVLAMSEWECSHAHQNWSWSSDGKKFAFIHKGDVWIKSVENGNPVQITKTKESDILPEWSPDGEKIVYVVQLDQGKMNLHVISASGGESIKILDNCAYWSHAWSPNSKEIVAASKGEILALSIDGKKERKMFDLNEQGLNSAGGLCWLPDGKHLAFIDRGKTDQSRIYIVPAKGGDVIELATDDNDWKDWIYPSPDGKWISYNAEGEFKTRPESTIWEVKVTDLLKEKK